MDREFIGTKWLRWLEGQGVGYVVRIKGNTRVSGLPAWKRPPKSPHRKDIWGLALFYSGCSIRGKNTRDDYLFLASKRFHGKEARALYRRRWGIELVFGHFKKRGFDLETTHMSDPAKVEKLFGVLTLAFPISYGRGCEMKRNTTLTTPRKKKEHLPSRVGPDCSTACPWRGFRRGDPGVAGMV